MDDDPIVKNGAGFGLKSNMVKLMCRKKQRLLTQAWEKWIEQTKVVHDYAIDARIILSRARADDELLDELEIEVLHKWVIQYKEEDPTGLSALLTSCRSKSAKIQALQSLRLEQFEPGELILCQNTLPRADDGLFTILNGSCDVLQFPEGSMALLNLGTYFKNRDWDAAKEVLNTARLINTMHAPTGFGELASLALIKRTASVRASPGQSILTELLVIPRRCLYAVLQASTLIGTDVHSTSEAIDFLRQSGLAMSSSSRELFRIACSMRKKVFNRGKVLYEKNEVGTCCYIIVSGEIIADTQYCPGEAEYADDDYPYICSLPSNCFILSNGSLLGDEAFLGVTNAYSSNEGGKYQSTASVISEVAVVFQIAGVGLDFLLEKLNSVRYSALAYMNISPWSVPITQADSNSVYTMFNSLRKCVSESNPYRGIHHSLVVQRPMKLSELGLQHHHHHHHRHHLTDGSVSTVSHHKFGSVAHGHHASGHNRFEIPHDHHSHSHQQSGGGSLATSTGGGLGGDDSTFEDEVDTLPVLPNPVIQHALRIKRDLKNAEAVRIRAIAKDGILHDELKRRGEQSSEKSYMSIRLSAAQRMLEYNIAAYKDRCDGTNPVPPALIDDDDVSEMSSAAHKSQKPAAESNYGVDFAIDADDDLLDTGSDGSEWSDEVPLGAVDIEEERRSKLQKATAHLCSTGILQHHAHVAYNKRRQEEKKTEVAALALQAVSSNFMQSNINKRNGRNTSMPGSLTASIGGSVVGSSNNSVSGSLTEANVRKHIQTARNLASGAQTGGTKAKEGASNANEKGKPNIKSQFFIRRRIPLRYALTHEMDLNAPSNNTTGTLQIQRQASGQLLVELDRAVLDKEKTARAKVRRPEASPIDIESPREFMRMIRSKEFPNRRTKYTAEKEWSTRFVKTTDASHGTSHLVPLNVGGSDGLGNDLQDGAPARNRTVLYWEQMRGKKKGKGGKENEEGRSKPQSQSKTLSASVTFGGVNSGSVVPGAAGGAEADVEAERSRAGSLDEADLGHIIAASTEISRMNTTDMDGEGQGAIKEPKVIGHVRFQDDQTVGTPPRVVTPRERPKSGEVVSAKEVEGVAVATGTGSVSSSTVPIPAPVDVSTDAGAGSLSTTPVRSKGSETPTTPGGSTATASSTPTAAARKSGVDEHGNRLSLAQLNPGADALERLRVRPSCLPVSFLTLFCMCMCAYFSLFRCCRINCRLCSVLRSHRRATWMVSASRLATPSSA